MPTLHLVANWCVPGDIIDSNTDLLKVELVDPQNITITKLAVNSLSPATGAATIIFGNQASGAGDEIVVTFSAGNYYAETTGTIETTTTFFWIRSGNPAGLSHINISPRFSYA